jgi:SAM-dependent methyltransferase
VALGWVKTNANRFNRVLVFRNSTNSGLGLTRNVGFDAAETPLLLPLDPDNRLLPDCAAACLEAVQRTGAAFAYPVIRQFGAAEGLLGTLRYDPVRLSLGNYIDAMAIVAKSVWLTVGGYEHLRTGWEDFDLWCKFAERGFRGVQVPGGPFAEYRVHSNSMTQTVNNRPGPARAIMKRLEERHPWLTLIWPLPYSSREAGEDDTLSKGAPCHGKTQDGSDRLMRLLPILQCPETGGRLRLAADGGSLLSEDSLCRWPLVLGRPMLFPGMETPKVNPDSHLSNELPESALALIRNTPGLILHLSAGGTKVRFDNVIEAEAAVFRNTDLIADVHRLPLADGAFDAIIALNAFEHYRDPRQAAREIYRVLRPGGRVLIRTAFLQPLHEAPWHFYNCTRYGLEAWFEGFETEKLHVSDNFHAGYSLSWLASECESALRGQLSSDAADAFLSAELRDILSLWRRPEERVGAGASLWDSLSALPQEAQESVAAGFEYVGRRP